MQRQISLDDPPSHGFVNRLVYNRCFSARKRARKRRIKSENADLAGIPPWDWPPTASVSILAVLVDREAPSDDRELAAELAGNLVVMNDDLAGELLRILENPSEPDSLRGQAAISFGAALEEVGSMEGGFFDGWEVPTVTAPVIERARAALRKAHQNLGNPKEVRRSALEASARAPEPWHADAVRTVYGDEDPEWRLTSVFCMRFVQGFEAEIVEALESADPMTLFQAVQAARDQGVLQAWPRIRELVRTAASGLPLIPEHPGLGRSIVMAAMHAVAMIRPDKAEEMLSPFIDSNDEDLADAAMGALDVAGVFLDEEEEAADPTLWN